MNRRQKYILVGVAIGAWSLGHAQGVVQHQKPIVLPKIVVHKVETVKTVTRYLPAKSSCPNLLDTANKVGAFAALLTKDSGKHVDTMTAGGEAIYSKDQKALTTAFQTEYQLKAETDVAAAGLAENTALYQQELKECESR